MASSNPFEREAGTRLTASKTLHTILSIMSILFILLKRDRTSPKDNTTSDTILFILLGFSLPYISRLRKDF